MTQVRLSVSVLVGRKTTKDVRLSRSISDPVPLITFT